MVFSKLGLKLFLTKNIFVLPEWMSVNVCISQKGQKRAADPLELELEMVVSRHVGDGDPTWMVWESSQGS